MIQNQPNFPQPQPQPPAQPQQLTQNKCKVFIDNLDPGIQEDYLYKKFKEECGQIVALKINKEKATQKSKGTAVITFSYPDFAEEARKKFNGQVLIKNVIRVKPYLNIYEQDKQANIYIGNLDDKVTIQKLEETFSEFGNVQSIDIKLNSQGKKLGYGYIQFESKDDVKKLLDHTETQPIIIEGKAITIEKFKTQSERQGATKSLYFRAISDKTPNLNPKFIRAYEHGWKLQIEEYFRDKSILKSVFVKYDPNAQQPWAMLVFNDVSDAQDAFNECANTRGHGCLKGQGSKVWELLQKYGPSKSVDGTEEFKLEDVKPFFDEQINSPQDLFRGGNHHFFYNQMKNKYQNIDKRLLLVRNIRPEVSSDELEAFFTNLGTVVRLTLISKNPKFKTQQAYIHLQTETDANRALSEVHEKSMKEKCSKIFAENIYVTILVPRTIRKEMKALKHSQVAHHVQGAQQANKLLPQWGPPIMNMNRQPMNMNRGPPMPQFNMPPGGPGQLPPGPRPQVPFNPNRQQHQQRQFRPQNQQRPPFPFQPPMQPGMMPNQFQQIPRGVPMPIQQQPYVRGTIQDSNLPPQLIPQQIVQTPIQRPIFSRYEDVKENQAAFQKQTLQIQRQQLGLILHPKVDDQLKQLGQYDPQWAQRITGMLIDEKLFEIHEIIQLLEDSAEFTERVQEGLNLIKEEAEEGQ